jgi:hypothetical protein
MLCAASGCTPKQEAAKAMQENSTGRDTSIVLRGLLLAIVLPFSVFMEAQVPVTWEFDLSYTGSD